MRGLICFLVVLAGSCSDDVGLEDAAQVIDAGDPGRLQFSWTITRGGAPATCADVAGTSVTIDVLKQGVIGGSVELFDCTSAMGTSRPLSPGKYDVRLSLEGTGGRLAGPVVRIGVDVLSNQTTAVEPVAFDVP